MIHPSIQDLTRKRYKKELYKPEITAPDHLSCTYNNVYTALQDLQSITNQYDFVFIFVFTHGRCPNGNLPVLYGILTPVEIDEDYSYDDTDYMYADVFTELVAQIPAQKKVIWMQPCYSGGFSEYFDNYMTGQYSQYPFIVNYSAEEDELAWQADDKIWDPAFGGSGGLVDFNEMEPAYYYTPNWGCPIHHGEFSYHLYSALNGETPKPGETVYIDYYGNQIPLSLADANGDGIVSVEEAYNWGDEYQTRKYNQQGQSTLEHFIYQESVQGLSEKTSLKYPNIVASISDLVVNMTSSGIETNTGIYGITNDVIVPENIFLIFGSNSKIYLLNDAKIIIQSGAKLTIEENVNIYGNSNTLIEIQGELEIGGGTVFNRQGSLGYFGGLKLSNLSGNFTLSDVTFNKSLLENHSSSLSIISSTFDSCAVIESDNGIIKIQNSEFVNTCVDLVNAISNPDDSVFIQGCSFTSEIAWNPGILLESYQKYQIISNEFDGGLFGIGLEYCGSAGGSPGNQVISNNTIANCYAGIATIFSTGAITNNHIYNNYYGVKFNNNSNIAFYGNQYAIINATTQEVRDNVLAEIYAGEDSFPFYFVFNVILDEDNIGYESDPLVYWNAGPGMFETIKYNCWGSEFDPEADFYPSGRFLYLPTWCPGMTPIPEPDPGEDMYNSAENEFVAENFEDAQAMFHLLIEQYPESRYAQASMKELFRLEAFAGGDYTSLQEFYLENDSVVCDTVLQKLGEFLANRCDIEMANWPEAISWYENIIMDPGSMEDSIFAIIDLENLYFVMQNSAMKSTYTGSLKQYIPTTRTVYKAYKDSLMKLLPGEKRCEEMLTRIKELRTGELLQNVPNPFNQNTEIWYSLSSEATVIISIQDYTGKEIYRKECGRKEKGKYFTEFSKAGLKPGIYFYSLILDGRLTDTKKMNIIE